MTSLPPSTTDTPTSQGHIRRRAWLAALALLTVLPWSTAQAQPTAAPGESAAEAPATTAPSTEPSATTSPAPDAAPVCNPGDPGQVRLQISVSGMHTTKGDITITIYPDDAEHFLDGAYKLARQHLPVTMPVTHACFVMAKPGYYAVALFGDENGNGHFDTNFLGIPTEGYGFSNNPTLYFGPPDLDKVRIEAHRGDNPIAIEMKYY